jgi:hypothetical protein
MKQLQRLWRSVWHWLLGRSRHVDSVEARARFWSEVREGEREAEIEAGPKSSSSARS